jgi:hypothetical protein
MKLCDNALCNGCLLVGLHLSLLQSLLANETPYQGLIVILAL